AENHGDIDRDRHVSEKPEESVSGQHENDDHSCADVGRDFALSDRILPKTRTNGTFLNNGERRRQRAGSQQNSKIVRAFDGKVTGNLTCAAEDRLANNRCRYHLIVQNNRERPAYVFLRYLREFTRTGSIESERDDRLACSLIEAGLGVGKVTTRHQDSLLDEIRSLRLAGAVKYLVIRRNAALCRLLGRHRNIDHPEIEFGGLSKQFLKPGWILKAGHLHKDAVRALTLDEWLDCS